MANQQEINSVLTELGFGNLGVIYYGSWKGYAVTLRRFTARVYYADVAVRLPAIDAELRKALNAGAKERGLKFAGTEALTKERISLSVSVPKAADAYAFVNERLDAVTSLLRENGVAPAGTCAITGSNRVDSLCLLPVRGVLSFQPVCAAAVRQQETSTRERVEENQQNGSYALGIVGALLGMLVGLIPNLLSIVFAERIIAALFALVPLCAMFGYKLFKGKMNTASLVIVIAVSLLAVLLIPYLVAVIKLVKDYRLSVGQAVSYLDMDTLRYQYSEISGKLMEMVVFMAIGIGIAWSYMKKQTNGGAVQSQKILAGSLRPNPDYQVNDDYQPEASQQSEYYSESNQQEF